MLVSKCQGSLLGFGAARSPDTPLHGLPLGAGAPREDAPGPLPKDASGGAEAAALPPTRRGPGAQRGVGAPGWGVGRTGLSPGIALWYGQLRQVDVGVLVGGIPGVPLSITSASICLDAFKKKKKSYSVTRDAFLISSPSIKERGKKK